MEYDVIWCIKNEKTCKLESFRRTFNTEEEAFLFMNSLKNTEYRIIKEYYK